MLLLCSVTQRTLIVIGVPISNCLRQADVRNEENLGSQLAHCQGFFDLRFSSYYLTAGSIASHHSLARTNQRLLSLEKGMFTTVDCLSGRNGSLEVLRLCHTRTFATCLISGTVRRLIRFCPVARPLITSSNSSIHRDQVSGTADPTSLPVLEFPRPLPGQGPTRS